MIIVITGPTGVGKTKLSISLAKKYNAEIINGDSIQIYRGLDIGSAKVLEEEMEGIKHHLFSVKDVKEEYSIFDYQKDCRKIINDIKNRGKNVIIVGGTGLYIKSALYDYKLSKEGSKKTFDEYSTEELYNKLISIDKDIVIDRYNRRRLERALNYYYENNASISKNKTSDILYDDVLFVGLTCDRLVLYDRINKRVDIMIENGLIDEVKSFYDKNIRTKPLLGGIGYKELYEYFDGFVSLEEAINLIKRNSRRYAKRQYTFFNHQFKMNWFLVNFNNFDETIIDVSNFIDNNFV